MLNPDLILSLVDILVTLFFFMNLRDVNVFQVTFVLVNFKQELSNWGKFCYVNVCRSTMYCISTRLSVPQAQALCVLQCSSCFFEVVIISFYFSWLSMHVITNKYNKSSITHSHSMMLLFSKHPKSLLNTNPKQTSRSLHSYFKCQQRTLYALVLVTWTCTSSVFLMNHRQ